MHHRISFKRSDNHPGHFIITPFLTRTTTVSKSISLPICIIESRKHASSNDMLSRTQWGKPYISSITEKTHSLYILAQKILCGFISTNPSVCLYIPSSERSPTAGKTAWMIVIDIRVLRFLCVQTGETRN